MVAANVYLGCCVSGGEHLFKIGQEARDHFKRTIPDEKYARGQPRQMAMQRIRALSAQGLSTWSPEDFLNFMVARSVDERLGQFFDQWSPSFLLHRHGFDALLQCESVLAVSARDDGDVDDIVVKISITSTVPGTAPEELCVPIDQGRARMAFLLEDVQREWSQCGHNHWGDHTDVQNLSEMLNIGILMFCNQLQNNGQDCLYNMGCSRGDFPYWIGLWWDPPLHFRIASVRRSGRSVYDSVWQLAPHPVGKQFEIIHTLPDSLRLLYNRVNKEAPVGQPRRNSGIT